MHIWFRNIFYCNSHRSTFSKDDATTWRKNSPLELASLKGFARKTDGFFVDDTRSFITHYLYCLLLIGTLYSHRICECWLIVHCIHYLGHSFLQKWIKFQISCETVRDFVQNLICSVIFITMNPYDTWMIRMENNCLDSFNVVNIFSTSWIIVSQV